MKNDNYQAEPSLCEDYPNCNDCSTNGCEYQEDLPDFTKDRLEEIPEPEEIRDCGGDYDDKLCLFCEADLCECEEIEENHE